MSTIWKKATFLYNDLSVISGDADAVKTILTGCTRAIIASNTGWELDGNFTQDLETSAPVDVNSSTSSSKTPIFAYYLKNTNSNAKMMLLYGYDSSSSATNPLATNGSTKFEVYHSGDSNVTSSSYYTSTCDLCISMLSGRYGITESFGTDCAVTSFIPTHATRLSSINSTGTSSNNLASQRAISSWGNYASYYFGCSADGNSVTVVYRPANLENSRALPTRIYGKIYSSLFNSTDLDDFGSIRLWSATSSYTVEGTSMGQDSDAMSQGLYTSGYNRNTSGATNYMQVSSLIHATEGDIWLSGSGTKLDTNANAQKWFTQYFNCYVNSLALSRYDYSQKTISSSSGKTIKLPNPIVSYSYETDWMINNYGVVSGNGIKGTLDQNVISWISNGATQPYLKGTIIDDGYTLVTSCWGVCYGWDPSNSQDDNPFYVQSLA